jgi:hypothetical protein
MPTKWVPNPLHAIKKATVVNGTAGAAKIGDDGVFKKPLPPPSILPSILKKTVLSATTPPAVHRKPQMEWPKFDLVAALEKETGFTMPETVKMRLLSATEEKQREIYWRTLERIAIETERQVRRYLCNTATKYDKETLICLQRLALPVCPPPLQKRAQCTRCGETFANRAIVMHHLVRKYGLYSMFPANFSRFPGH